MDFIIDSTILQSLLLSVIFLAILVEIKTGGTGIGALLGIIAAGVFFGSSYVKGLVSLYQIAIFIVGIIFIIIEILTPTIGLLAGLGVVAICYVDDGNFFCYCDNNFCVDNKKITYK